MDSEAKGVVLYVDDEEQNLLAFRSAFRRIYDVHTALSAEEGLKILENESVEIVITDQRMPDMTGTEFLERVLPAYPHVIRMILTGFSDMGAIVEAINRGQVYRYINKPWDKDDLKIAIDNALEAFRLRSRNRELIEHLQEANRNLEEKVADRTAELRKKNENIIASINYARRIQEAILPVQERIEASVGAGNFFILYKPRDIVSGDFYWYEAIANYKIFIVADCTGHGVPGALMSMVGSQVLSEVILKNNIFMPDQILYHLHKEINRTLRQKESNSQDGMDMIVLVWDQTNVYYAGAMNPLFYCQKKEPIVLQEIKATKKPIGGLGSDEERIFDLHTLPLQSPMTFYLCTDGYQDQFGGQNDKKFMLTQLKALLTSIAHQPMEEQKNILDKTFEDWKGAEQVQIDDVTIVGLTI